MKVLWFIPTHGDGRYLGTSIGGRRVNHAYFSQIARAVDDLGFYGALLPTGRSCEDAWMVASSLIPLTRRMRFLVAIRPGLMSPGLSARMTSSFDRLSGGRILINVVTGGDPEELAGDGLHLSHDERYEVTDEFLSVWRGMLSGETVQHSGKHLDIRDGRVYFEGVQKPYPPLWFGGSSPAAIDVAAKHIDTYLTWGEPPEQVGEKIEQVRRRAAELGRSLRFGIRLHVIVRETVREAWQDAERLIQFVDDATIEKARALLAKHDSVGQQRMLALHGGDRSKLEVSPNLWAGVGLVRGGAGTALVGDAETVAERMREYASLGVDTFILSGYPHLEEAYRVAELLFPQLPLEHGDSPDQNTESIRAEGEMMANRQFPSEAKPVTG